VSYVTATTEQINVEDLSHECVTTEHVDADWSEGYPERWEYREVEDCEACERPAICHGNQRTCSNEECELYDEPQDTDYSEGPMMNYYYPLPERPDDDDVVLALDGLPLCVVDFNSEFESNSALALTGGGMDLSWEICEAHMRLGYLPPVDYCSLPQMAGRGQSPRDRKIIEACRASANSAMRQQQSIINRLDAMSPDTEPAFKPGDVVESPSYPYSTLNDQVGVVLAQRDDMFEVVWINYQGEMFSYVRTTEAESDLRFLERADGR
jgi:hypothetical protein